MGPGWTAGSNGSDPSRGPSQSGGLGRAGQTAARGECSSGLLEKVRTESHQQEPPTRTPPPGVVVPLRVQSLGTPQLGCGTPAAPHPGSLIGLLHLRNKALILRPVPPPSPLCHLGLHHHALPRPAPAHPTTTTHGTRRGQPDPWIPRPGAQPHGQGPLLPPGAPAPPCPTHMKVLEWGDRVSLGAPTPCSVGGGQGPQEGPAPASRRGSAVSHGSGLSSLKTPWKKRNLGRWGVGQSVPGPTCPTHPYLKCHSVSCPES